MRTILIVLLLTAGIQLAFSLKDPITISGFVYDKEGKPISGAFVQLKGTKKSVTTDTAGAFIIEVPGLSSVLVVSYIGFETQETEIKTKNSLMFLLEPNKAGLNEVLVMGKSKGVEKKTTTVRIRGNSTLNNDVSLIAPSLYGSKSAHDIYIRNTEGYDVINENRFLKANENPLSTFSIDVDAASYSNVRRFVNNGQVPPVDAVRIEELINYFSYNYPQPVTEHPFAVHTELASSPWNKDHQLVMVGLQGKKIPVGNLPPSNLVFLIDVSGSMQDPNKLPLVKASMKLLAGQLRKQDHVSIAVYAGAAGLVLPPTNGSEKNKITDAIDRLEAGGSTAGSAGIKLAYSTAKQHFLKEGNNRVILCTDGDFNVGVSSDDALIKLIEEERRSGVFLTVLGFGMGNYQDAKMQKLADKGNGNHAYIDQLNEAKKVLVNEFGGTLFTIAKDVKLQVEFNPALVKAYRLIGYENRLLNKEDFNNDKKDAGEMGSGHTVTALYEIIPVGVKSSFVDSVDALKYQSNKPSSQLHAGNTSEMMTVKIRYKKPEEEVSKLLVHTVAGTTRNWEQASENFRFAAAVAAYGMIVRQSEFKGDLTYNRVLKMVAKSMGTDTHGYRREFKSIVENTALLSGSQEEREEDDLGINK